jgi:oligopeptide/dipeptide ABC transporter ATP-binding protein
VGDGVDQVLSSSTGAQAVAARPETAGEPLLELREVVKHFPVRSGGARFGRQSREVVRAVDNVSLELHRGETLGLVGETGCGKSTLGRLALRLLELTSGSVTFDSSDISRLSDRRLLPYRQQMQMIFQDPYGSLNGRRRVGSIIGDPFAIHGVGSGNARRQQVQELMELVGLNPEHYNRFPAEFSGGQRQRIGVARALALHPKLVVCDEPVSALDVSIQAQIVNLLAGLQRDFGLTYLFISHDLSVVRHLCDRIAVMYLGEIVEIGPVGEVGVNPRHPYTAALLSAVPVPDPDAAAQSSRVVLRGDLPSPINPPSGCRFHPRCPRAQARCEVEAPRLDVRLGADAGHLAACHFPLADGERLENVGGASVINRTALLVEARRRREPVVPGQPGPALIEQAGLAPIEEPALIEELGPEVIEEPAAMLIGATATVLDTAPEVLAAGPPASAAIQDGQAATGPTKVELRSPWFLAYQRLRRDRASIVSASVILAIVLFALLAPVIAHLTGHGVDEQFPTIGLTPDGLPKPPSGTFLLGTDDLGRDLLVRVAYGARISLLVGVLATALTVFVGAIVGLISGYFSGLVDTIFARVMDVMLAIPFLLFAISLASVVSVTPLHIGPVTIGSGISIVIIVIGIFSWATVARIVRGQVIAIRNREYVEAARALGARSWRIIVFDVLPNVLPTIIVYTTLLIPVSIVSEAALSYLGVGVEPPTADWGSMIAEAQTYYQQAWWFLAFPSLALILTTLAFNILGDGIRDAIDPRGTDVRG